MSYEKKLFNEVIHVAAGKLSPSEVSDLLEWVEWLEDAKRKVDKYEDKSKAFDAILKSYEEASHEGQMIYEFSNIIEKYESGEANA